MSKKVRAIFAVFKVLFALSSDLLDQPHLAQGYSRRIALIVNGVDERKIYDEVQLGVNKLASGG